MESELKLQESIYRNAHDKLLDAHKQFDEDVKNLYQVYTHYSRISVTTFFLNYLIESPGQGN